MSARDELAEQAHAKLLELLEANGGHSVQTARAVLGPGNRRGLPTDQRSAANARTREYKARQALARAPESEDVVTACGYVVLDILAETAKRTDNPLRARLLAELRMAGFDEAESLAALERLAQNVNERRQGWHRRLARRIMGRLLAVVPETLPSRTG